MYVIAVPGTWYVVCIRTSATLQVVPTPQFLSLVEVVALHNHGFAVYLLRDSAILVLFHASRLLLERAGYRWWWSEEGEGSGG